jgi:hypothetical protein
MALFFYKYLHNKKIYKMSEFTTGTVKDLRYLYENVVHGEQEVLKEAANDPSLQQAKGFIKGTGNFVKSLFVDPPKANRASTPSKPTSTGTPTSTDYKSPFARGRNAAPGIGNPTGKDSRLDSPIAGKGPRGNEVGSNLSPFKPATTPRTAPGGAGAGSPPNARSMPARPVLSKQGGVEGTGTGANFKAGAWSSADKSRYSAQAAKAPSTSVANAEKARIRGTNQTDNPLMKDFKSSLPAPTSSQSPAVSKLGAGNQSLTTNPSVPKPASPAATPGVGQRAAAMPSMGSSQYKAITPSAAIAAAPSSSAAASGGNAVTATKAIADAPKPITPNPSGGYSTKEGDGKPRKDVLFSYQYEDAYDLVLEYLLDDGHAATIAEAEYIMTELDSEVINQIVETRLDPRGRPASGPMNVYANPKGKPDQAHLDAVKAYDEKQKKKTPEQRKKELDAYIARQRNK